MSNLSSRAQRSIRKAKWLRSTELPVWWPLLQVGLVAVFVVWFIVSLGSSPSSPAPTTPADLPGNFAPSTLPSLPATGPEPSDATSPTTPVPSGLVSLPWVNPDGSLDPDRSIAVPEAALERARLTASASFPGAAVTDAAVRSYEERDLAVFVFATELTTGEGSVEVTVVFRDGAWVTAG